MSDAIHIQIGYSPLGQINLPGYEQKSLALHFEKKQADNVADTQSDTETDSNLVALRVKPKTTQIHIHIFSSLSASVSGCSNVCSNDLLLFSGNRP